jgi:ribosome-binding factor A
MRRKKGKAPSQRQLRVGEELRHILAELLGRGDLHDPALAGKSITVSEVRSSPDMRHATVFVMPLGGKGDVAEIVAALNHAGPYLSHEVGRRITMKFTPRLHFELDQVFDEALHIETLLHQPAVARDLIRDDTDDTDDGA